MSANHARRRRSGQAEVTHVAEQRTRRIARLINVRDRLAVSAAEYAAHHVPGVEDLQRRLVDIEELVKAEAPRIYAARWIDWVRRDAELMHTPGEHHPYCGICRAVGNLPA